jgi:hypothetical protein
MPRLAWLACLALLAFAIAGCGGGDDETGESTATEDTGTGPIASASSIPTVPEPTGKHGPHYFQTPSKNIGCYLSANSVRCDIRERSWSPPPKPKFCIKAGVDWGQGIGVGEKKKAGFTCAGDTVLGGPELLGYGQTAQRGSVVCLSSRAGMACENSDTDHGFFLSRERYRIY